MASARPPSRPGAGPGRGRSRARTRPRAADPTTERPAPPVLDEETTPAEPQGTAHPRGRRASITTRAIALAVVFLILTISYASSLRIYFAQAEKISATRAEIVQRQEEITELQGRLAQWNDPAYVRLQARERLGWVVPGEIGFKVIGPDGKPLGGGAQITAPQETVAGEPDAWWLRLRRSLEAADRPAPAATPKPAERKPITAKTTPTPLPSPAPSSSPR
jgi:cell division protein FtsB